MRLKFPHFPREIAARVVRYTTYTVLWLGIVWFFVLNIYAKVNLTPSFWPTVTTMLRFPYSDTAHRALARAYWQSGLLGAAIQELGISNAQTDVLGATTYEPELLKTELDAWLSILSSHPDYRDGYIWAAGLAYELGKATEAKTLGEKALNLDPENSTAQKLLGLLEK